MPKPSTNRPEKVRTRGRRTNSFNRARTMPASRRLGSVPRPNASIIRAPRPAGTLGKGERPGDAEQVEPERDQHQIGDKIENQPDGNLSFQPHAGRPESTGNASARR